MKTSQAGIDLIKSFEGIRDGDPSTVNLDPYICPAGVVTIGWGHAVTDQGRMLRGHDGLMEARELYPDGITPFEAEDLLRQDIEVKEQEVNSLIHVPVTQGQFDALVSFAFNVGTDIDPDSIPEGLGDSSLLKYLNAYRYEDAAREFPKWVYAGGRKLGGLVRRREAEMKLFLSEQVVA